MRLMRQALAEGEAPLGGVHVVLAQIRDDLHERIVERDPALLDQVQNARGREDHLGERGEIEPCFTGNVFALRLDLRNGLPIARRARRRR